MSIGLSVAKREGAKTVEDAVCFVFPQLDRARIAANGINHGRRTLDHTGKYIKSKVRKLHI
jgi:hypothetical protein